MDLKAAPESDKTMKARKKLENRLKDIEDRVTQQALRRKVHEMKVWISKYAFDRVIVKDSDSAPLAKKTEKIAFKLKIISNATTRGNDE